MTITRYSPSRVVGVTLGLSAAGIVCGGVAGATAGAVALVLSQGFRVLGDPGIFLFAGGVGAVLGAVCAPLAGWLLLRHVPLGRAFGTLTVGAIIGGLLGWFAPITFNEITQPIVAAAGGFLAAAILLRFRHGRTKTNSPA